MLKRNRTKELFQRYPEIRIILWRVKLWTSRFYASTVGQYFNEEVIKAYLKNQRTEKDYKKLHSGQLPLF